MRFACLGLIAASAAAKECDIFCAMIYSVSDDCECVPIEGMECNPQYNVTCSQYEYDLQHGRDPEKSPYRHDDWYYGDNEGLEFNDLKEIISSGASPAITVTASAFLVALTAF